MSSSIQGIAASAGIAIAKAFTLQVPNLTIEKRLTSDDAVEYTRLDNALAASIADLEKIKARALRKIGEEQAAIFQAHLLVLSDPEWISQVKDYVANEHVNVEFAVQTVSQTFIELFEAMDNEYMRERAADIRDVTKRVLAHLLGQPLIDLTALDEEVIIVAEDLTPSDTAQLNKEFVQGFTTDIGGRTSHSAILARTLEIPAVVGTNEATRSIHHGDKVIVDGLEGHVIINPSEQEIAKYREKQAQYSAQAVAWAALAHEVSQTADGHQVELTANIGAPDDVASVLANGGEGIGLYRTEFLYMGRKTLPTEDEQFEAYKAVLEKMENKPVIVRTLDIGGDKELPYLRLPHEMNPFLGYRAIRLCLDEQTIFRTQLRALLRASVYGNLKIMFPMIATIHEFREAKAVLLDVKAELQQQRMEVSDTIDIGMMVEIPSSAVMADVFAKEVDFFSIGTNDLIQYTMAADRMNERVAYLYQPYNPAILKLVQFVINAAQKEGKWVGMCGEMAGDEVALPILLGLGLDEFSMSATSILRARSQLKRLSIQQAQAAIPDIMAMATAADVEAYVREKFNVL
ncbi:phosphoenolpyruvate--protein phosphotransferase [Kurthia huakuii]|uniref:phosphoenolpyruvate--protein phosphotransferase n=1 Tax=Kurthia huakuii TaxID=1421019 RepID=UPI000495830A|nr:phosphoenolpyruvate--protein phosphotransferase [Kurthia huakuii]MBM7700894.1 phosphotransferase system enzyme I (PtsI) [Kurthia huakuii]